MLNRAKELLIGLPLPTKELHDKRLNKVRALAAFSPDALSSIAYANQEIYLGLLAAGTAGALSRREREVAELVGAGMTNREIAQSLFVTENTIETRKGRVIAGCWNVASFGNSIEAISGSESLRSVRIFKSEVKELVDGVEPVEAGQQLGLGRGQGLRPRAAHASRAVQDVDEQASAQSGPARRGLAQDPA